MIFNTFFTVAFLLLQENVLIVVNVLVIRKYLELFTMKKKILYNYVFGNILTYKDEMLWFDIFFAIYDMITFCEYLKIIHAFDMRKFNIFSQ